MQMQTSRGDELNEPVPSSAATAPSLLQVRFRRGFLVSLALSIAFLVGSAFQSAATLAMRLHGNSVMEAASGGVWTGQIGREIALFVLAQLVLHVGLAILVWVLAVASAVIWQTAREKFGRIVVGWFCIVAAAVIAYNAYWFPRTGLGAYYHDTLATMVGPLPVGRVIYLGIVVAALLTLLAAIAELLRRPPSPRARKLAGLAIAGVALAFGAMLAAGARQGTAAEQADARPNVILIGIDSLRLAELRRFGGTRDDAAPRRFPRPRGYRAGHDHAGRAYVSVLGFDPDRTQSSRNGGSIQPGGPQKPQDRADHWRRAAPLGLQDGVCHRRSPLRQHRRDVWLRPGRDSADRRLGFPDRHLQRIAARVGRRQFPAGADPVSIFLRKSRGGVAIPAGHVPVSPGSRGLVRRSDAVHYAPDGQPLAVLHFGYDIRRCRKESSG